MTDLDHQLRARFYRERDLRTVEYVSNASAFRSPVSIHLSSDACNTETGQLLSLTLANQLARIFRHLRFAVAIPDAELLVPTMCGATTIGEEIERLATRIDPYGQLEIEVPRVRPCEISIGIGPGCPTDLAWYLGCDLSCGQLRIEPCGLGRGASADLRGAGVAALLGASAVIKSALNIPTVPTTLSAWNLRSGSEADLGPVELPSIDVGRGLIIGGGAVASAVAYWLMLWGNRSAWTVMDRDFVKLHNTNRCLLFFPEDAGWPDRQPKSKVSCIARHLADVVPVFAWYDQATEAQQVYDTVLVLANERHVRTLVSSRHDPIQLQATTGQSWSSALHRHIAGRDDCVRCRMADISPPKLACSGSVISGSDESETTDAALPFLSAASGLMAVSMLQRIQIGDFGNEQTNIWRWDFRSCVRMHLEGIFECHDTCSTGAPAVVRKAIAAQTRWAGSRWSIGCQQGGED